MVKVYIPSRRWKSKTIRRRSGSEDIHFKTGTPWTRRRAWRSSRRIKRVSTIALISRWKSSRSQPGALSGRFSEPPPTTGCEPIDLTEENISKVAPTLFQGGSACSASTCNSRDDMATTPVELEINQAQIMGMLASPLHAQEREASADPSRIYHCDRENSVQGSSLSRSSTGKPVAVFSHNWKSSRWSFSDKEGEDAENQEVRNTWRYMQIEHFKDNGKLCLSSLKQNFIRKFFLKNREVKYSQRQDSNYFCQKGERNMQITRYRIWIISFALKFRKHSEGAGARTCLTWTRSTTSRITMSRESLSRRRRIGECVNFLDRNCGKASSLWLNLQHRYKSCRTRWDPWVIPENFNTSNQSAVRDYPTSLLNQSLFRVRVEFLAATTASDLIHEPYLEHQETFLKIQLHQLNRRHRFRKGCCMEEILSSFDGSVFLSTGKKLRKIEMKN